MTQAERKAALGGAPVYMFWLTRQTPAQNARPRAFHCGELPFVFNNTDRVAAMTAEVLKHQNSVAECPTPGLPLREVATPIILAFRNGRRLRRKRSP